MKHCIALFLLTVFSFPPIIERASAIEPVEVFQVWPGEPPGDTREIGEEKILEGRRRPFYQITDVSVPTVSVFLPPKEHHTGNAILVCPGGGLQRLAIEHEGLEVADWLTAHGITAFVLKYRVPAPVSYGLRDAQRALGLIRARADEWAVDPENIGILGFSAGGEIAAWLSTHYSERQYDRIDDNDSFSCRPDFAALIYPGGLIERGSGALKESIASRINRDTPPMFLAHAFDDSCENSLQMVLSLKRARVPAEVHIFQEGAHGFGVRETGHPVNDWRERFLEWMQSWGFRDKRSVRDYERAFSRALQGDGALPRFSENNPQATLEDAYAAQKRLVRRRLNDLTLAGFKGGVISEAAQQRLGIDRPLTGVLFQEGQLNAEDRPVVEIPDDLGLVIETEIGYIVSVDIGYHVLTAEQAKGAAQAVVPVIELPLDYSPRAGTGTAADMVAMNMGSSKFIIGNRTHPDEVDPDAVAITLKREGRTLHETTGATAKGGQWENLRTIINQLVDQGYTLRQGSVIISGALGTVHPGEPGHYRADYGELGVIEFELR